MKVVTQLSIFLENKPGVLAEVASELADKGINILGISVSDTVDHAVVRLVLTEPSKARDILESHGVLVVENEMAQLDIKDEPGALAKTAAKLAGAGVNIEYAYGSAPFDGKARLYLRVSDTKKAAKALK